jgi:hypothetical protein
MDPSCIRDKTSPTDAKAKKPNQHAHGHANAQTCIMRIFKDINVKKCFREIGTRFFVLNCHIIRKMVYSSTIRIHCLENLLR